jgi:predicted RND superfamily exporter protein
MPSSSLGDASTGVSDPASFDPRSGSLLERLVFGHHAWVLVGCGVLTVFFAAQLRSLEVEASFEKTLPQSHPYIRNFIAHRDQLRGLGDVVHVVVENPRGDIFDRAHLDTLQAIHNDIFLLPGVDRAWMKSIWAPVVRWSEVTEEGFAGGPVMPQSYDGSDASLEALRLNVLRAGLVGSLVAHDLRSSAIVVPLLAVDGDARPLDLHRLASSLEAIRERHESRTAAGAQPVRVHIVGFAKLMGDLIDGLHQVIAFFAVSGAIAGALLFAYTRCWRSTALVLVCSLTAVVWQLGLVAMGGLALDPFTVLVPFLVFAIGVSHGTQKLNGILQDAGRGAPRWVAARRTFRRLFGIGLTALLANALGFVVLMVIDIPVIHGLAICASLGVGVLVFTNLVLLPVLLSCMRVQPAPPHRSALQFAVHAALVRLTGRPAATAVVALAAALGAAAFATSLHLQVGDLDPGAPELRADSRYNRDLAYIASRYGVSSDVFAVMVKTPPEQCGTYANLTEADRLAWTLAQLPGVQRAESLADTIRTYTAGSFDGSPKWQTISGDPRVVDSQLSHAIAWSSEFVTPQCSVIPVLAHLSDHKAATLATLVATAERFAAEHGSAERQFLLAAGSAGIQAASNIVVAQSNATMLAIVFASVALLCAVAFRSWRAALVALVPLLLTSVMAEALMVLLGIGLKVATLPVVALGAGIGVDYALYLLGVQLAHQRAGASLADAFAQSASRVGGVVALVGATLAAGVVTWAWSPIRFQADMGVLLTFMFLWNMLAALTLVPALSHFLLPDIGRAAGPPVQLLGELQ